MFSTGFGLRDHSLWAQRPYSVLGMKPSLAACKANILPSALSLHPQTLITPLETLSPATVLDTKA